ncbi:MAG: SdrD B-like domain-containing protein, partial [Acidobacteriota bacterium]
MILSASATLLLAAGSLWAAPQEEGLTFSNSNPRVLSVLEAEGFLGGGGVEKAGGADVYIPAAGDQCAGVVEVDFRRGSGASARVAGVQVIASRSDGEAFVPQALSRSRGFSTREALVVSGGGDFRVEVSYFFAQDAFGQAVSATKIFSARVGCDTVVPLGVEVPDLGDGDGLRRLTRADARKVDHEQSIDSVMSRRYDLVGGGGVEGVAKAARIFGGETRVTPSATPAGETSPGEAAQGGAPLAPSSSSLGTGTQCSSDGFDGDTLGGEWSISFLGDADLGSATESGGTLQVSGNGSSFFHGDDNGIFVHRSVDGDFRIEATVTDFPAVPGDSFAKSGINARTGTGANDARVFVQVVPDHPTFDTTVIQFDYRDETGRAFELASQLTGAPRRVSLAIDRRGDLFRVYYSLDDGATWNVPAGAAGGEVEIPVGSSTMEVGFSTSSYDASPSLTAEFDDFSLCQPNMDPAPMPPPPVACIPGRPTNVIFLLDRSGSMTFPYPGADSKLDAARSAIYAMNDLLASNLPGSQAALIAFSGNRDPQFNLNSSAQVLSGLTTDLDAVNQAAAAIDVGAIDPISSTPLAIALEMTTQVLQAESGDGRLPLLVWLTDTVPNVDSLGFGPSAYRFEEVSQISLLDSAGVSFRPWGEVAWEGNYNAAIDTYDGQVLGDAMREILEMKAAVPDTTIFGVAIQSDEVFNEELMDFAATFTGGNVYSVAEADAILDAVADLVDLVDCGANIQGRVWFDMDAEGDQDAGEAGLETVTVELLDSSGSVVMTTETGPDGMYMFEGVLDGNYTVRVVDQTLPAAADRPTFDIDGIATPHLAQVSVVSEQDVVGVDFGYTVGTVIGGGPGCTDDSFDDGLLSPVWMLANVGDADQGAVAETGGSLELTTDGTSLFHGDDNGAFVYQMVEGDFRSEVRVDGFPVNVGGDYRKAGLAYRSGTQPDAARVMVMVVADYADTGAPAIQFDTRTSDGGVPVVLSSTIQNISLPVHLSIERRQDQITVSVSQDGGTTWRIPAGGLGGSEMISALGGPALIGLMGASYDADQTLTARFDDFQLCQPDDTEPPPPPPPTECVVGAPKDYVLLLDQSGSMAFEFPGMVSKFEAAKASLTQLIASIDALDNGSRVALITFSGERDDPAYNLNESVKVRSGLTTDLGGVITQLDSLSMRDIPWYGTTPLPLALDRLTQLLTDQRDPSRESIVYWISDQLPNIDSAGQGPREYPLDKLDDIPLRDGAGNFLPPGVVAFSGPYHGTTDTFCGEPLGNSMDSIVTLSQAHPDVRVFGVTLAGDGMGFGTFSFDLNQYAAFYTNGDALLASNAVDLTVDLLDLLQVVNCDEAGLAQIGDRVWNDSDGDGLQEAGETGIPGVRVYLLDLAGDLVATADTGADGDYLFIDVPPGTYTVEVAADSLPAGLRQT